MDMNLKAHIDQLKRQKNAVILAHYYAPPETQALADYIGDSFYLAKVAKSCDADILVFCGVSFMGESAKILNPHKKVLMPDRSADCAMAHMVAPGRIDELRAQYPDLAVVCYINSTSELKCQSDVCVTSANAVKIVRALPNQHIFFIPDHNLGNFVAEQVPEKTVILNDGACPIHRTLGSDAIRHEMNAHPDAVLLAHPECEKTVLDMAEFVGSTSEIIDYAHKSPATEFIIGTEEGVLYKLRQNDPDKHFYFPTPSPSCHDMKRNTPERVLAVLQNEDGEVTVDEATRARALLPLDRMLELAR